MAETMAGHDINLSRDQGNKQKLGESSHGETGLTFVYLAIVVVG
jgi:hypothetical protein